MKSVRLAVAVLVLSVLLVGVVHAQMPGYGGPALPAPQAGIPYFAAGDYQNPFQAAPGARPVAYLADDPAANGSGGNGEEEEEEAKPWRLFHGSWLEEHNININGWLDMGITGNADNPASGFNGTLAPNDRNEFQFNQTYLVMEKTLNTEDRNFDLGGRVDVLYGTDYIYGLSTGFETHPDGSPKWNSSTHYGVIMPQVYGEVGLGKLSFKLGRFYTTIGYESLMAPNNFFYSMNYALRFAEPTTHTGGLFTWKASDALSIHAGGVNGTDATDRVVDTFALLTGFSYAPKEAKYAFNFSIMTGGTDPTTVAGLFEPRTYFSLYFTYNFSEKWQSVSQFDAGWQQNFDGQGNTADFWSVTQYLFYKINDQWKAGLRYDMFVDDQGTRLGGLRVGNPLPLPAGAIGAVQAVSAGVNYTPYANLRLRPELRWDWFDGPVLLFDDQTKNSQFTAAIDAILLY